MQIVELLVDEQFLPAATNLISRAEKSVYVSTFKAEMTTRPRGRRLIKLFDRLIEKSRRDVDVRLLLNRFSGSKSVPFTNNYAIRELKRRKVNVRCFPNNRICHAKMIIVDDTAVILGSHNLSVKSCHNNFECSLYCDSAVLVNHLSRVFIKTFESAKEV